jgi:hypothetical protein
MEAQGLFSGLVAGTTTAAVCAPVDRALFLSHVHKRPFLQRVNFDAPFQGVSAVLVQRIFSSGMIFPLEDVVRRHLPAEREGGGGVGRNLLAGTLAASLIAVLTNPLASVTAQKWCSGGSAAQIARSMWLAQGLSSFNRAIGVTLARDMIWGGSFSVLRHGLRALWDAPQVPLPPQDVPRPHAPEMLQQKYNPGLVSFGSNVVAAGVAAALASPFNYARNLQYSTALGQRQVPVHRLLLALADEASEHRRATGGSRLLFCARRFTVGWGTLRVSFGIALSSQVYEATMQSVSPAGAAR